MGERYLGIEVTSSRIKVAEIDASTTPPKVFSFASFDLFSSHPENISQQLISVLSHMDVRTKKARVSIEDDSTHQLVSFPPMPKKEMKVVAERELKNALGPQVEEMVFGWQVLGDDEEGKKMVLLTAAPLSSVREKALLFRDVGLSPDLITTVPLSLFNALKLIQGSERSASALVYLGESKAHAIFIRDGKWAFCRELTGSEGPSGDLLNEMNRSLLYFRHQFRGEEIRKVFLSGEGAEGLEKSWSESLGVKVEHFCPNLDLSPLKGRAEEFRLVLHQFVLPIGLAGKRMIDYINLPDPEVTRRAREAGIKKAAIACLMIFALVMGVSYGNVSRSISNYKRSLLERKQELNKLGPYLTAQQSRAMYKKNLALLMEIDNHTLWAEALREMCILVPQEIAFQSLRFKRENGKITLSIKGEVLAPQALAGQEIFSRFYSQLESSPLFTNVEVEPSSIKVTRSKGVDKGSLTQLVFELKGELAAVEIEYESH